MAKRVIKLTESDIKNIVDKVLKETLKEQSYADMTLGMSPMAGAYWGAKALMGAVDANKRIQNLANIRATVDSQGTIKNPSSKLNGTKFVDYITQYNITDEEIKQADELIKKRNEKTAQTNARLQNIINIYKTVDAQGIIRNPTSQFNGKSWSSYIADFGVTQSEVNQAKKYAEGKAAQAATTQSTRMTNLVNILKTVDAQGIIKNPSSKLNGTKWSDYVTTYKITPEEIAQAKQQIGGSTQQPSRPQRQPDQSVVKIQQDLNTKGYNLKVDGIMGPKTRAAMEAEKAKASGTTTQPTVDSPAMSAAMKSWMDEYRKKNPITFKVPELSPEQQAVVDRLKAQQAAGTLTPPPSQTNPPA